MTALTAFFSRKEILFKLVSKNLKGKYAGSSLGIIWAFINPLLLAFIVGFVFTKILKVNIENFYLFIIAGMLPWTFLATSLQESALSIPAHASVLKQFSFPREFIPLSCVLANFVLLLMGLLVVMPFFIMANTQVVLLLPILLPALLVHLMFVAGLSLAFSAAYVYFRDIGQLLGTLLIFWLWLTPVFYSMEMIPQGYRIIFICNPITLYIGLYRDALLGVGHGVWGSFLTAGALAIISLIAGYKIFIGCEKDFLQRI
jgi:ABC-2 type transport system permease protein